MTMKLKGYLTLAGLLMASSAMGQDAVTLSVWSDTPRLAGFGQRHA